MVEQLTNTIRVEAYSWIASILGAAANENQKIKKQVKADSTVYDFFNELAENNPKFCEEVFNPQTGQLSDQVMIIMNGKLVQSADLRTTRFKDNDKITLSPVLVGG